MATWEDVLLTILYVLLILLALILIENLIRSAIHRRTPITPDPFPDEKEGLIFGGHATMLFRLAGTVVLTDPSLTSNYFWFYRKFHDLGIRLEDLSKVDLVVISHTHPDHNHPASLRLLARFNKHLTLLVPPGYAKKFNYKKRYGFARIIELGHYESVQVKDLTVTNVPAEHSYSRNASGWVFEKKSLKGSLNGAINTIYFAGDTGYNQKMFQEIGSRFTIDLAFLPMGCFEGRMFFSLFRPSFGSVHMSPRDLPQAIDDLKCRVVVPIHWGTYIIGCEGPKVAPTLLDKLQKNHQAPSTIFLTLPGELRGFEQLLSN